MNNAYAAAAAAVDKVTTCAYVAIECERRHRGVNNCNCCCCCYIYIFIKAAKYGRLAIVDIEVLMERCVQFASLVESTTKCLVAGRLR